MLLALMISLYFGMDKKIGSKPKLGSIAVVFKRIIDRLFSQKDEEEGCGSWRMLNKCLGKLQEWSNSWYSASNFLQASNLNASLLIVLRVFFLILLLLERGVYDPDIFSVA
ncbi:hypothetical protein NC652_011902 [Populus alba x Populus x berolinensis]|nr:hypothetical protein NC652_011902 [Populus alba x Populus x berolinensis]